MGDWRGRWENQGYRYALSDDERNLLRVRWLADPGLVRRFTVQYEAVIEGRTYPVIRWDTAHGFVHRDTLDRNGRVIDKLPVYGTSYNDAMTDAIADIKRHWPTYREAFERRPQ
jgi:hypothetical protein